MLQRKSKMLLTKEAKKKMGGTKVQNLTYFFNLPLAKSWPGVTGGSLQLFSTIHVFFTLQKFIKNHRQQKITVNVNIDRKQETKVINEHSRLLTIIENTKNDEIRNKSNE